MSIPEMKYLIAPAFFIISLLLLVLGFSYSSKDKSKNDKSKNFFISFGVFAALTIISFMVFNKD